MKQSNDPYKILGINPGTSLKEIKKAYKDKAQRFHPDKGGTVTEWLKISNAYDTIIEKKHVPIITTADTQMLDIALDIKQQIQGVDDYIRVEQDEELYIKIKIPPGALAGDRFQVKSHGKKYIINVKEKAHSDFTRDANNLIMYKTLDIIDVMLGKTFMIENAIGNYIEVEVPEDCNTGTIISLKEQGLFNRKTKRYGNLRIFIALKIPHLATNQDIENFIKRLKND
jgi:DnaJ-class molecular chaperone